MNNDELDYRYVLVPLDRDREYDMLHGRMTADVCESYDLSKEECTAIEPVLWALNDKLDLLIGYGEEELVSPSDVRDALPVIASFTSATASPAMKRGLTLLTRAFETAAGRGVSAIIALGVW